jgi:hypothetical protein
LLSLWLHYLAASVITLPSCLSDYITLLPLSLHYLAVSLITLPCCLFDYIILLPLSLHYLAASLITLPCCLSKSPSLTQCCVFDIIKIVSSRWTVLPIKNIFFHCDYQKYMLQNKKKELSWTVCNTPTYFFDAWIWTSLSLGKIHGIIKRLLSRVNWTCWKTAFLFYYAVPRIVIIS